MRPRVRAWSRPRFHGGCGRVCFVENVEVCAHGRLHGVREHGISLSQMHGESGRRWEWVSVHLRGPLRCADLCGVRRGLETATAAAMGTGHLCKLRPASTHATHGASTTGRTSSLLWLMGTSGRQHSIWTQDRWQEDSFSQNHAHDNKMIQKLNF